jgi:5-hydroxyisourate hydrolase
MASGIKDISTHVLDLTRGKPAQDVPVRLERRESSGGWRLLASAQTDHDGRCAQLLPANEKLSPGVYRLVFDLASYYVPQKVDSLYPLAEVAFYVREGEDRFHIPLLLSPNGYTTYRGS